MTTASRIVVAGLTFAFAAARALAQDAVVPPNAFAPSEASTPTRLYASAEYLTWWLREGRAPLTLTTGSFASRGRIGQSDTEILYGDERLNTRHSNRFVGSRFQLGWWLDPEQTWAVEAGGIFLERDSTYFKAISDGSVLLARPWYDVVANKQRSEIIAGPTAAGVRNGGFSGYSRVEFFSQEANLVGNLFNDPTRRLDALVGGRFLQMRDRTDFTSTSRLLPDETTLFGLTDHFRVHNAFYGGQLGLRSLETFGPLSLAFRGDVALGANVETLTAYGTRIIHTPLGRTSIPYGLVTTPTNTGQFQRAELNALYELGVNAGYQVTQRIKLFGGYTFLLWDGAVRSGDQIELAINPNPTAGGPLRPQIPFKDDVFWAHGLNVGLQLTW